MKAFRAYLDSKFANLHSSLLVCSEKREAQKMLNRVWQMRGAVLPWCEFDVGKRWDKEGASIIPESEYKAKRKMQN